jgi:hypothetical protein
MTFTEPAPNATFTITTLPLWPAIVFATDSEGPHTWDWTIAWDVFSATGTANTAVGRWNAAAAIGNRGGKLTVKATAGGGSATITVNIRAVNPSVTEVTSYLSSRPNSDGFGAIVAHETNSIHFRNNVPIKSGDSGYGICQLTNPRPTFEQVWNWKMNVDAGLALFSQKRFAAMTFLSQSGRAFTNEQLRRETVCRWNGGPYHRWDDQAKKWTRNPDILCDTKTRNIGWDMTMAANTGKTAADLRTRDHPYAVPRPAGAAYNFFGLCYADRVLG